MSLPFKAVELFLITSSSSSGIFLRASLLGTNTVMGPSVRLFDGQEKELVSFGRFERYYHDRNKKLPVTKANTGDRWQTKTKTKQ